VCTGSGWVNLLDAPSSDLSRQVFLFILKLSYYIKVAAVRVGTFLCTCSLFALTSAASSPASKPIISPRLIVFLEKDCPCNVLCAEDLNRISDSLMDSGIIVEGYVNLDQSQLQRFGTTLKLRFPLKTDVSGALRKKMGVMFSLESRLVSKKGQVLGKYAGYSQSILRQMESDIKRGCQKEIHFDTGLFPDRTRIGCSFK
jgi:hypothetical protein